jgi:hypothetical protein
MIQLAEMSTSETALVAAGITAAASLAVGVIGALSAYFSSKRDRRRGLYGEATKSALAWREMLYRVRRRQHGDEAGLVTQFHELQDQLTYYTCWIASESKYMARSYEKLVSGTKAATDPYIAEAWKDPIRSLPGDGKPDDEHPNLTSLTEAFLADVRSHLSPIFVRKLAVAWRNRRADEDGS